MRLYDTISIPIFDTKNGILAMLQHGSTPNSAIPFEIKKVLFIKDMKNEDQRGGHTHHKTSQILISLSGKCKVDLDNGYEKETVELSDSDKGLVLYPYTWHVMRDFSKDTILLVLADTTYDEKDYIRNYDDFIKIIQMREK